MDVSINKCLWGNCDAIFDNPNQLYSHIELNHIGFKKSNSFDGKCYWDTCNIIKVSRTQLRMHVVSHINVRKHICQYCPKSFKWKQDLEKHVVKHHKLLNAIEILFDEDEVNSIRSSLFL